jgi:hypothetical protein
MSKTPLKQDLQGGAYKAALGGLIPGQQDGMAQGMDDLMELSQNMVTNIAERKNQAKKQAQDVLRNGGGLGEDWLGAAKKHVKEGHDQYLDSLNGGDDGSESMIGLEEVSGTTAEAKDTRTRVAEIFDQNDLSEAVGEDQLRIMNAVTGKYADKRIIKDGDNKGKWEVDVGDGEYMMMEDVDAMLDEYGKDYTSIAGVRDKIIKSREQGVNQSGDDPNAQPYFDMSRTVSDIDATLKEGKIRSLINDDILGEGTPWGKAVEENPEIKGMTYASLGLTPPPGDDGIIGNEDDPDGAEAVLNSDHRGLVVDALVNPDNELFDEDRTRGLMASYIGMSMQNNYNEGFASNRKPKEQDKVEQPGDQMYVKNSDGSMAPVSAKEDQYKDLSTEELLAMYPPKQ